MIAILNIILAALGFGVALAPIGGETWNKKEPKLLKRITRRGWIAIILLSLSLVATIYKEKETSRRDIESDKQRQKFEQGLKNLSEGFQSAAKKLEILSQTAGATVKIDQGVIDLKKDIQRYQVELLRLRNSLPAARGSKAQNMLQSEQARGGQKKDIDEYHEITKPIMEVK